MNSMLHVQHPYAQDRDEDGKRPAGSCNEREHP